jgi:hypothetical protein
MGGTQSDMRPREVADLDLLLEKVRERGRALLVEDRRR